MQNKDVRSTDVRAGGLQPVAISNATVSNVTVSGRQASPLLARAASPVDTLSRTRL
jgi:hypothetical protein